MFMHSDVPMSMMYFLSVASMASGVQQSEDSWIAHSSAVARVDSDESALGCPHSAIISRFRWTDYRSQDGVTVDDTGS